MASEERRRWPIVWCVLACAAWLLTASACSSNPPLPDLNDLLVQLERNPIGPDEEVRITKLVESPEMSGLLVQVRGSLPPHFHKHTHEVVFLVRGEGLFQLGTEHIAIKTGAVMRISPDQVHTFTNQGPMPAVFFVVTSPRWDEQDRFTVKD